MKKTNKWESASRSLLRIAKAASKACGFYGSVLVTHEGLYATTGYVIVRVPCDTGIAEGERRVIDPDAPLLSIPCEEAPHELQWKRKAPDVIGATRDLPAVPVTMDARRVVLALRALITLRARYAVLRRGYDSRVRAHAAGKGGSSPEVSASIAIGSAEVEFTQIIIDPRVLLPVMQACTGETTMRVASGKDGVHILDENGVEAVVMPVGLLG